MRWCSHPADSVLRRDNTEELKQISKEAKAKLSKTAEKVRRRPLSLMPASLKHPC